MLSDEPRCAELLVQHGADVNSKNSKGATPVMIAATKGCYEMLRMFAQQPGVRLADQVCSYTCTSEWPLYNAH